MSTITAWRYIFNNLSSGSTWQPIPDEIKCILGLDSRLGICAGILCTRQAAQGQKEFLDRVNKIGGK